MVRMLPSRDTGSEVNIGSLREQCVCGCRVSVCVLCLLMHKRLCVSMCTCLHVLGGVKMDPSGQAFSGRVPVDRESRREGWWLLADGVQQGRSSLLMKSHLRPPFTLNMGHCSCPDLGFDPQRCLTPTIPSELPPCHLERMHAYVYIHACTHPQIHYACTRRMTQYTHMRSQVLIFSI